MSGAWSGWITPPPDPHPIVPWYQQELSVGAGGMSEGGAWISKDNGGNWPGYPGTDQEFHDQMDRMNLSLGTTPLVAWSIGEVIDTPAGGAGLDWGSIYTAGWQRYDAWQHSCGFYSGLARTQMAIMYDSTPLVTESLSKDPAVLPEFANKVEGTDYELSDGAIVMEYEGTYSTFVGWQNGWKMMLLSEYGMVIAKSIVGYTIQPVSEFSLSSSYANSFFVPYRISVMAADGSTFIDPGPLAGTKFPIFPLGWMTEQQIVEQYGGATVYITNGVGTPLTTDEESTMSPPHIGGPSGVAGTLSHYYKTMVLMADFAETVQTPAFYVIIDPITESYLIPYMEIPQMPKTPDQVDPTYMNAGVWPYTVAGMHSRLEVFWDATDNAVNEGTCPIALWQRPRYRYWIPNPPPVTLYLKDRGANWVDLTNDADFSIKNKVPWLHANGSVAPLSLKTDTGWDQVDTMGG